MKTALLQGSTGGDGACALWVAFAAGRAYHPWMSPSRALQTFEGEAVTVTFDPRLCIHSEECVHGLPAVFDPTRKRWIRPDEAPADKVVAAVARCPSGALRVWREGSAVSVASPGEVVVTVSPNGPLLLRGRLRIESENGDTIASADAAALCRCGCTANPPYCDGSHTRTGFIKS
jgi:uncharacterized Fe-S cluster protein YjdI